MFFEITRFLIKFVKKKSEQEISCRAIERKDSNLGQMKTLHFTETCIFLSSIHSHVFP